MLNFKKSISQLYFKYNEFLNISLVSIISKLFAFSTSFMLLTILGSDLFSEFIVQRNFAQIFIVMASSAFGVVSISKLEKLKNNTEKGRFLSFISTLFLLFCTAIFLVFTIVSQLYMDKVFPQSIFLVLIVFTIGQSLFLVFEYVVLCLGATKLIVKANVINIFFNIILWYIIYNYNSVALYFLVSGSFYLILSFIYYKQVNKSIKLRLSFNYVELKELFVNFIFPIILSGLTLLPLIWFCLIYLKNNLNDGGKSISFFEVANQLQSVILFVPLYLSRLLNKNFSKYDDTEIVQKKKKHLKIQLTILKLALPVILVLYFISPYIILYFGLNMNNSKYFLLLHFFTAIIMILNSTNAQYINSEHKFWLGFGFNVIFAVIFGLVFYLYNQYYSLSIAVIFFSYFASYFIVSVCQFFYIRTRN